MNKNKSLITDVDKKCSVTIIKANSGKRLISEKGTVEIRVLDSKGSEQKLMLFIVYWLPPAFGYHVLS